MDQQKIDGFFRMIVSIYGRSFPASAQESLSALLEQVSHQDALEVLSQLERDDDLVYLPTPKRIRRMFSDLEDRRLEEDANREREVFRKGTQKAFSPVTEHGHRSLELIRLRLFGDDSDAEIFAKLQAMERDFPGFGWAEIVKSFELQVKRVAA